MGRDDFIHQPPGFAAALFCFFDIILAAGCLRPRAGEGYLGALVNAKAAAGVKAIAAARIKFRCGAGVMLQLQRCLGINTAFDSKDVLIKAQRLAIFANLTDYRCFIIAALSGAAGYSYGVANAEGKSLSASGNAVSAGHFLIKAAVMKADFPCARAIAVLHLAKSIGGNIIKGLIGKDQQIGAQGNDGLFAIRHCTLDHAPIAELCSID